MRRTIAAALLTLVAAGVVGLGIAIAGIASTDSSTGTLAGTTESTTESTTEGPSKTKLRSVLAVGQEVPKPTGTKVGAGGTFTVTVTHDHGKYSASFKLSYRNLTGKAVAAHIHKGKPGKAGPVLVPLCGPCTSGKSGTARVSKAAVAALKSGGTYVNVHTAKNPSGEIRGQIKKIG